MQQLTTQRPPFLCSGQMMSTMMKDTLLVLALLLPSPAAYYDTYVLWTAAASVVSCLISEIATCMITKRWMDISELSSMVTGLIIAMLTSQMTPLWLPVLAGTFMVLAARVSLGFIGSSPFNPATAGVTLVAALWPRRMFSFSEPFAASVLRGGLKLNQIPPEMLRGTDGGAIRTIAVLVVAACVVYLIVKKMVGRQIIVCLLAVARLVALLFPCIMVTSLTSLKYELLLGSLLFRSVFLIVDPVTLPRTRVGKAPYDAVASVLIMPMCRYGAFEQAACSAVLPMNAVSPVIDSFVITVTARREARRNEQ